jgi:hypothetical protein
MAKKAFVYDGSAWVEITSQPSVATGTTGNAGIVQLVDSTSSVSTANAATPNAVKSAYDAAVAAQATADAAVTPTGTQTLSNKTLTAPKFDTAGEIDDINGNELIKFPSTVASAVNEVTISNAATGVAPSISASGTDTNIDLSLVPKGTGNVSANKLRLSSTTSASTTSTEHAFQIGPTSGFNLRLAGGSIQAVSNGNANTSLVLQPSGGTVTIGQDAATTLNIGKAGGLRLSDTTSILNYVELKPPSTGASASYTLPGTAPATSGQVLSSTTAGVMSWITPASGGGQRVLLASSGSTTTDVVISNIPSTYSDIEIILWGTGALDTRLETFVCSAGSVDSSATAYGGFNQAAFIAGTDTSGTFRFPRASNLGVDGGNHNVAIIRMPDYSNKSGANVGDRIMYSQAMTPPASSSVAMFLFHTGIYKMTTTSAAITGFTVNKTAAVSMLVYGIP